MNFNYDAVRLSRYEKFCSCNKQECRCEENTGLPTVHEWSWDESHSTCTALLSEHNLEVKFNRGYSCGTAAVRGNKLFEKGRHHYWEVKMITPIYGTDVMVGVGTGKVDLNETKDIFCSLLGSDQESFGFSYRGYIQHRGEKRSYGSCFGQGSLVGVHLDMWKGTLEFYLNRKPLGIAFTGLRDIVLYPMASSTAAQSKMRLTHSCSLPASLQLECLARLRPVQKTYLSDTYPGLRYLSESIFAEILRKPADEDEDAQDEFDSTKYMILDDFDFALVGASRKKRKKQTTDNYSMSIVQR